MHRRRYLVGAVSAAGLPLVGCTGDGDAGTETEDDSDVYREAFRNALEDDGHAVGELSVDGRVRLSYSPAEPSEDGVRQSVNDAARAFFDRVYGGWDVDGLDARVLVDGELVATWRMERTWIESYLDGELSREELGRKVEDSVERRVGTATGGE